MEFIDFKTVLFYAFAAILAFAALRVVTARNPVHAALYLVLSFFSSSAVWILLKAEFLALILMLVYVGAVMVLFLFVVMMLDIKLAVIREHFRKNLAVAMVVGILIVLQMVAVILRGFWVLDSPMPSFSDTIGLTRELGIVLYTQYLYPFEIAAAVLMVAMVAAVVLTLRKRNDAKYTSASDAVLVKPEERVRLVEIKIEEEEKIHTRGDA